MCRDSTLKSEMSHQWPRLVALGSMVVLAGCGSNSPAPAPSTVTVPSPEPVQLSGVATDDDGAPVVLTANVPANGELRAYPEVFPSSVTYSFTLTTAILR